MPPRHFISEKQAEALIEVVVKVWSWVGEVIDTTGARMERPQYALIHAHRALAFAERLVPGRIGGEELGDAMEVIAQLVQQGRPPWRIYVKVGTTIFLALLHTMRRFGRNDAKTSIRKRGS